MLLPCQQAALSSPTPRPPIRSQPSPAANNLQQNFYKPAANIRETLPIRITSTRGTLLPLNNGRSPLLAGTSNCCGARNPPKGKRTAAAQRQELNDPSKSTAVSSKFLGGFCMYIFSHLFLTSLLKSLRLIQNGLDDQNVKCYDGKYFCVLIVIASLSKTGRSLVARTCTRIRYTVIYIYNTHMADF